VKITVNNDAEPLSSESKNQRNELEHSEASEGRKSKTQIGDEETTMLMTADKLDRKPSVASNITSATTPGDSSKPRNSSFSGTTTGNELTVYSSIPNNSVKPGTEVLTLISTWIKSAPNDFMGKIRKLFVCLKLMISY